MLLSTFHKLKRCATIEAAHRKMQTPIAATQNQINGIWYPSTLSVGICIFTKFKNSVHKKGYSIPIKIKTPFPKMFIRFCVAQSVYHKKNFLSIVFVEIYVITCVILKEKLALKQQLRLKINHGQAPPRSPPTPWEAHISCGNISKK